MSISNLFDLPSLLLPGKDPDDFSLSVEGEELVLESGKVLRTVDTCADAFTASMPFDSSDKKIAKLLKPFGYKKASVYLGGNIAVNGILYNIENSNASGAK